MNVKLPGITQNQLNFLIIAGAIGAAWYVSRKLPSTETVVNAVNPTSRENIISRGFNAIGDILDDGGDNDSFSLGSKIFDFVHPAFDPNE